MKKVLSLGVVLAYACVSTAFADYTLTAADTVVVQEVIQKVQSRSSARQEVVIRALKNAQNKADFTAQKQAIFAAVESGLRKTSTVEGETVVLATQLEREHIQKALVTENIDQKDGSVTLDVSGKLTSTSMPETVTFDTHMAIDVDMHDLKNPKVRLVIEASGAADEENISGAAEMRVVDAFGFFKVATLTSTSPDIHDQLIELQPFLNIWWKVPLSETDLADIAETDDDILLQNDTSIEKILLSKNIVPVLQYMGQDTGVSTYGGMIDNQALLSAIRDIVLSQGEEISDSDLQEAENMLKNVSIFTEFSLTDKNIFTALSIDTIIGSTVVESGNTIEGNINIDMTLAPLKSPIVAPDNARDMGEMFL